MARRTSRRQFMQTSAAVGAGFFATAGFNIRESRAANETVDFGCIGVGGKGSSDSADAGKDCNVIAICDIDENNLNKAARRFKNAKKYFDWRKMLDEMGSSLNAVTVSTPDHTHAPATAAALVRGLACYTQKPLTHTIEEARYLGELARKHNVATQMGNQGTALGSLREMAAAVKTGFLGDISEVHVWTNRPVWPQGEGRPTETPEVPPHIHWDEFIGPAPFRPYHPNYHPFKWRGWWDFGTGALGDMACHTLNMPYAALELRDPTSVQAQTSGHNKETYPSWSIIDYEFPGNDHRGPITMRWYDGKKLPPAELLGGMQPASSGALIVGSKGSLYAPGDYAERGMQLIGEVEAPKVEYTKSPGHFKELVDAIKGGPAPMSNFPDYASPLTETVLLGNLAVWADGKKVAWDAKNLKPTNAPELESLVRKQYRKGWELRPSQET